MGDTKAGLFTILRQLSKPVPLSKLIRWSGKNLFCPFYHAVSENPLPHIRHLYTVRTIDEFKADIDFFLKHFKPLNFEQLLKHVMSNQRLEEPHFFLSFDDGLKEVYDVVAPIVTQKGVPAMVFLNSGFVDNRGLMFRYKASLLIEALKDKPDDKLKAVARLLETSPEPEKLITKILNLGYGEQEKIKQIASVLDVDFQEFLNDNLPYLNADQIRSMGDSGLFTFGAHSVDHPLYQKLELDEQLDQTQSSLDWLGGQSYETKRAFAFPFTDDGVQPEFFETMFQNNLLELSFGSAGLKYDEFGGRHIQRYPMEGTNLAAQYLVKGEYLYFFLKRRFGKGGVSRS